MIGGKNFFFKIWFQGIGIVNVASNFFVEKKSFRLPKNDGIKNNSKHKFSVFFESLKNKLLCFSKMRKIARSH